MALTGAGSRYLSRLLLAALAAMLLAASAHGQSADRIVKQASRALGGEKALRRITSWRASGTITRLSDGARGSYQAAGARPDLYTVAIEIAGFESSAGFNGKSGWRRNSREGLHTLTGAESLEFRAEAGFRNARWLDYKKEKARLALSGSATIGDRAARIVTLTTARNVKIRLYFDAFSWLLLKEEFSAGESVKAYEYGDYRPVDGVQEPFSITLSEGDEKYRIELSEVVHNEKIDSARFNFPRFSHEPLPDIALLIREVSEHQDEIERLLENYTYRQTITSREFDKKGAMKVTGSETFELTFYRGRRLRRLVAKNGEPLSAADQAKEDRRIEKAIRDIEKKEAEKEKERREGGEEEDDDERSPTISDILRASKLTNPRRERFRGREVIVFDFEPLPGYKPQKRIEKVMGKMAGAIWIDASDREVARVEARLVESYKIGGGLIAAIKPGSAFVLEQNRVNDEIWLPSHAEYNISVRAFFFGLDFNATIDYGDYRRFNVESEKERLKDPVKP